MISTNLLRGMTVRLTALEARDVPALTRWYQDPDFLRLWDAVPAAPMSEAQMTEWLNERRKAPNTFEFAIRPVGGEELLGYLELDGILWSHRVCGLGLGIGDPANRRKGYGREAVQLALAFAFQELNLHRVTLTVFSYNTGAIALYEKLGFRREGVFREHLERDGRRYDMYLYGMLRREWEALQAGGPGA